ncbi:hypothetical protein BC941DRAFT_437146 [Chlamydoabsidia padenii]|nr:hypothetical protein BC941DRAFT_437146 [Chlamydoabsidia padenii]
MSYHEETYNRLQSVDKLDQEEHKTEWTHQLLAGAAGFEALHLLNKKKKEEGQEVDHATAKELLAAFAAASVDSFVETKGMDWIDKAKAKQ